VSPGQACVFYDSADGQARVLGGGFIRSTIMADAAVQRGRPADSLGIGARG
jgi:tRNA-specific 2-thiouridylase